MRGGEKSRTSGVRGGVRRGGLQAECVRGERGAGRRGGGNEKGWDLCGAGQEMAVQDWGGREEEGSAMSSAKGCVGGSCTGGQAGRGRTNWLHCVVRRGGGRVVAD